MKSVGIRELKNQLSKYLQLVQRGQSVLVTDRGRGVAELRPLTRQADLQENPVLAEMVRNGTIRLGRPNRPGLYPRMKRVLSRAQIRRLLDEERGDR